METDIQVITNNVKEKQIILGNGQHLDNNNLVKNGKKRKIEEEEEPFIDKDAILITMVMDFIRRLMEENKIIICKKWITRGHPGSAEQTIGKLFDGIIFSPIDFQLSKRELKIFSGELLLVIPRDMLGQQTRLILLNHQLINEKENHSQFTIGSNVEYKGFRFNNVIEERLDRSALAELCVYLILGDSLESYYNETILVFRVAFQKLLQDKEMAFKKKMMESKMDKRTIQDIQKKFGIINNITYSILRNPDMYATLMDIVRKKG